MHLLGGVMGLTQGYETNQTQITEDNDGRFSAGYFNGHIDIAHILSRTLGRQMSQTATYRVNYLSVQLRNIDDAVDNSQAIMVGGNLRHFTPTSHRINAIQEVRQWMRERASSTASTSDPFADMTTDKNYKGLRYTWNSESDGQIESATSDLTGSVIAGNKLNMIGMFNRYNSATGGLPSDEGYDTSGEGQALWEGRASVVANSIQFATSLWNRIESDGFAGNIPPEDDFFLHQPQSDVWEWTAPAGHSIDVLGGIIRCDLTHGNVDSPGVLEDEYELLITVGVSGWDEF
jgi:hypothetical protein